MGWRDVSGDFQEYCVSEIPEGRIPRGSGVAGVSIRTTHPVRPGDSLRRDYSGGICTSGF